MLGVQFVASLDPDFMGRAKTRHGLQLHRSFEAEDAGLLQQASP